MALPKSAALSPGILWGLTAAWALHEDALPCLSPEATCPTQNVHSELIWSVVIFQVPNAGSKNKNENSNLQGFEACQEQLLTSAFPHFVFLSQSPFPIIVDHVSHWNDRSFTETLTDLPAQQREIVSCRAWWWHKRTLEDTGKVSA